MSNKNTTVNAKNPGTSRKLCNIPISFPPKLAISTAKLFKRACQTEKAIGEPIAKTKRKVFLLFGIENIVAIFDGVINLFVPISSFSEVEYFIVKNEANLHF